MNRDSRSVDQNSDRFAEQFAGPFSEVDSGLRIERPKVDWAGAVAKRRARRQVSRSIVGATAALCVVLSMAWYANRPAPPTAGGAGGNRPEFAENEAKRLAAAKEELVAMDRELSQLNRRIASLQRKERSRKANLKTAELLKANPPGKNSFSDPIEEGALVMLAAAEKTAQKEGKEAGQALYRRIVEIFPDSRSAEIARRELM